MTLRRWPAVATEGLFALPFPLCPFFLADRTWPSTPICHTTPDSAASKHRHVLCPLGSLGTENLAVAWLGHLLQVSYSLVKVSIWPLWFHLLV